MIIEFQRKKQKEQERKKKQNVEAVKKLSENAIMCEACDTPIDKDEFKENMMVCPSCSKHYKIPSRERIKNLFDEGTFIEFDKDLKTFDCLKFPDYMDKVKSTSKKTGETEGLISGKGKIEGKETVVCFMNPDFMMGSMGSVVGEKITRAIENAIKEQLPVIIFSASGGARMQEGIVSLMQMAKTSAALGKLGDEGLLYLSVLTDPTTGGVSASFSMLGDIIISEPNALICFAGPRVIEQTIRQTLPEGFQRAEFLKDRGFIDKIVDRADMRTFLGKMLEIHEKKEK